MEFYFLDTLLSEPRVGIANVNPTNPHLAAEMGESWAQEGILSTFLER